MKKRVLVLLVISLLYLTAKAQLGKEAWHWQFGQNAALDFSSGVPVSGNSQLGVLEGSASISDPNTGALLFYTDGTTVWNKNNTQMTNGFGLFGGQGTSTQGGLIIPKPGSSTIYYLVTADQGGYMGPNKGVNYTIIDMSLNGGLGDVIASSKNIPLTPPPATEKLVGIKHCNGLEYWIITHPFNSNAFNAYLVTSTGINTTPIVSNVGTAETNIGGSYDETIGYLKASPNGKKLALGIEYTINILELYDFDASTGLVSNPITMPLNQGGYGVSFSPDNSKLYTTYVDGFGNLYQYDLSSGIASTIIASQTIIASGNHLGALQIAPDGKIYMAVLGSSLSVINNPNGLGAACNYQAAAVNLSPSSCKLGLPNFMDANNTNTTINVSNAVQCSTFTTDTLNAGPGFNSYQWSTGAVTQSIIINTPGTYWVTVTNTNGCNLTDTIKAYTINPNTVHVLNDTVVCSPTGSYAANATYSGAQSYQWYDGTTNPIKNINASGTYSVSIYFQNGCVVHNTFHLTLNVKPTVNLGKDTVICGNINQPIILNAGAGGGYTYHWSTGAATQTISATAGGNYWVNVNSSSTCISTDTIHVLVVAPNTFHVFDTSLCHPSQLPIFLNPPGVPGNNNYYYWNDGHNGATDYAYYPGTYILDIYVNGGRCIITDIFNVVLDTARPHIKDLVYCTSFKPDTISAGFGYAHYLWSTGATTYSAAINNPGTYWVKTTSPGGCIEIDTFRASVIQPGNIHVLKDTIICTPNNYYYYNANAYVSGAQSYQWYDGQTYPTHYFSNSGYYWVDIHFSGGCVVRDSFHLTFNQAPYVYLGNDEAICGPLTYSIILNGGYGYPNYNWSTGAGTQTISVNSSGIYWVTVTAANGCKVTDSIDIQIYPYGNTTFVFDTVICKANAFPVILHSNVPYTYNNYYYWGGGGNGYGQTDYVYNSGTYYVNVHINGNSNCIVTDTFHVSTGTIVKPVIPDVVQCNSSTPDVLDAGTGYTNYYWSTGATTQSITVNTSGNYWVRVTNNEGCKVTDTVKIGYYTSPLINILHDTSICGNQSSITVNATYPGINSYLWNDGFTFPVHTISAAGNYWVVYTLSTTCVASDSFNVGFQKIKYTDTLPNIITPNNDGVNDFIDFSVYQFPEMQLAIYNRWGTKIFESSNPQCVWNPTCDDGTYFFIIEYRADCDTTQETKTIKSFFTVVK